MHIPGDRLCAPEKLTRRRLAGIAAGAAAAATVRAQAPAVNPDLEKARESHRQNSETLAKFEIPASTEPAFQFKA